jgi:hypothetical protein
VSRPETPSPTATAPPTAPATASGFHARLLQATAADQQRLLELPFVEAALQGALSLPAYVAFLTQAFHHVKHTVPLLMATGAALPGRLGWLRDAVAEYITEEQGHEEWILDDIAACGADAGAVRRGVPELPAELMVAYAWDTVRRGNPVGFFGMVHVLEGTSVRGATRAAEALQRRLFLPRGAFTYLTTHGDLDVQHTRFFGDLMERLHDPDDQACVLHKARVFFRLYGDVFAALDPRAGRAERASA